MNQANKLILDMFHENIVPPDFFSFFFLLGHSIQNGPTLEFIEKLGVSCTMDITHIALAACRAVSLYSMAQTPYGKDHLYKPVY